MDKTRFQEQFADEGIQTWKEPQNRSVVSLIIEGLGWGLIGGLAGTMVMDLVLMGALSAVGLPALTCFSIVGNTVARFFSMLGIEMAGGIPTGVATHYLIGPLVGVIFGAVVARVDALRVNTLKKSIILAILYVEILSQPILGDDPHPVEDDGT